MIFGSQRGQLVLVVVLSIAVALTVGLSVASRVVMNLKISKENEESQRAFQAAEAGLQGILEGKAGGTQQTLANNATFLAIESDAGLQGTEILVNNGEEVDQDMGADVWLSRYDPQGMATFTLPFTGDLRVVWGTGEQTICSEPSSLLDKKKVISAVEIVMLWGDKNLPSFARFVYDPCNRVPNSVGAVLGPVVVRGLTFSYSTPPISVANGFIMKVIPLYNSTKVAVTSPVALPLQGTLIESVGKAGETVRRIVYFNSYPQLPTELFPYALLSQ